MHRSVSGGGARRTAFTLVELLVVVGIIALLLTILMPSLGRASELARRAVCASHLHGLGHAWNMYWNEWNNEHPPMFNPLRYGDWHVSDITSQWNHMIWTGNHPTYGGTVAKAQWMQSGRLLEAELIAGVDNYLCPTVIRNYPEPWFQDPKNGNLEDDLRKMPLAGLGKYPTANYWPPVKERSCGAHMTYGIRRCTYYDDPSLAALGNGQIGDDHIMFLESGVGMVVNPTNFSFMADNFSTPDMALLSHVPGVNVLRMAGNVKFWKDTEGNVLYDNGLASIGYGPPSNGIHDDIWMIIDGYHAAPPGRFTK